MLRNFQSAVRPAAQAHALLPVEDRALGVELDGQRHQQQQRRGQHQQQRAPPATSNARLEARRSGDCVSSSAKAKSLAPQIRSPGCGAARARRSRWRRRPAARPAAAQQRIHPVGAAHVVGGQHHVLGLQAPSHLVQRLPRRRGAGVHHGDDLVAALAALLDGASSPLGPSPRPRRPAPRRLTHQREDGHADRQRARQAPMRPAQQRAGRQLHREGQRMTPAPAHHHGHGDAGGLEEAVAALAGPRRRPAGRRGPRGSAVNWKATTNTALSTSSVGSSVERGGRAPRGSEHPRAASGPRTQASAMAALSARKNVSFFGPRSSDGRPEARAPSNPPNPPRPAPATTGRLLAARLRNSRGTPSGTRQTVLLRRSSSGTASRSAPHRSARSPPRVAPASCSSAWWTARPGVTLARTTSSTPSVRWPEDGRVRERQRGRQIDVDLVEVRRAPP